MKNATVCYLRSEGRTLMLHRSKGKGDLHDGYNVPPGGKDERGERGIDCVVREFQEETGLKIKAPKLRAIVTFYNEGRILGGEESPEDWRVEVFEASEYKGTLKEEHPRTKPQWIADAELKNLRMYPADRRILELLDQEGVYEVLVQYSGEDTVTKFDVTRVA